jgi:hypothetical protein
MFRKCLTVTILAAVISLAAACTPTPDTYTIATLNGKAITLKDVQKSPNFKNIVDELIMKQVIEDEAAKKGIKITDEKITEEFDKMRKGFPTEEEWKNVLDAQGMTEKDVKDQVRSRLIFFELLKANEKVTDEEAKAEFDANPDYYRNMYAQEKNLTVDEAANLKFEDMKEYLVDQMKLNKAYPNAQKMIEDLKAKANIVYTFMTPEERDKLKKREAEQKAKRDEAEKKAQPVTPPAENGSGDQAAKGDDKAPKGEGDAAKGNDKPKTEAEKPKPEEKKDDGGKAGK